MGRIAASEGSFSHSFPYWCPAKCWGSVLKPLMVWCLGIAPIKMQVHSGHPKLEVRSWFLTPPNYSYLFTINPSYCSGLNQLSYLEGPRAPHYYQHTSRVNVFQDSATKPGCFGCFAARNFWAIARLIREFLKWGTPKVIQNLVTFNRAKAMKSYGLGSPFVRKTQGEDAAIFWGGSNSCFGVRTAPHELFLAP